MPVPSLGREDPLEEEMATHSSTLAWRIPWTEEPGGLQSMGSQRVGHDWAPDQQQHLSKLAESETLGVEVKQTPTSLSGDFGTDSRLKPLFHGAYGLILGVMPRKKYLGPSG